MAEEKKYTHLSRNFFRGAVKGQINSVYKDRETKPEKVAEYKQALKDGDASLGESISKQLAKKLVELGVEIPEDVKVTGGRDTDEGADEGAEQESAEA